MAALWVGVLAVVMAGALPAGARAGGEADAAPSTAGDTARHAASEPRRERFFLGGDGVLEIENAHTREKILIHYRDRSGRYSEDALAKLDALFRSRGDDARARVALRLVELIDYLEDHERPKNLLLISGYRSEGYNDSLIAKGGKAARASMHSQGLAADLRFTGVDHRALWLRLRNLECCGAGYYKKSGFLHVDTGRPRFWEEGTSRVGENLSKGNARVIARTDFDRYDDLIGLETTLHAVTLPPLRVSSRAVLRDDDGSELAGLVLTTPGKDAASDGCLVIADDDPGARDVLRVASIEPRGPGTPDAPLERKDDVRLRARVVLTTCEPRLEATPARVESNPIETSAAALQARRPVPGGG